MTLSQINCKKLFQQAYEKRYTWPEKFNGYKGKCQFFNNHKSFEGEFFLGENFKPVIKNIIQEDIVKNISHQLFEVSIHRVKREFNSIHSKNNFEFLQENKNGVELKVTGKCEGDKYRIKDGKINMVFRKIHGVIIEIFVQEFFDTSNGFLSQEYSSQQLDPDTMTPKSPKLNYVDRFLKFSNKNIWLLNSREIKYHNEQDKEVFNKFVFKDIVLK